jgi:hypothetical protein
MSQKGMHAEDNRGPTSSCPDVLPRASSSPRAGAEICSSVVLVRSPSGAEFCPGGLETATDGCTGRTANKGRPPSRRPRGAMHRADGGRGRTSRPDRRQSGASPSGSGSPGLDSLGGVVRFAPPSTTRTDCPPCQTAAVGAPGAATSLPPCENPPVRIGPERGAGWICRGRRGGGKVRIRRGRKAMHGRAAVAIRRGSSPAPPWRASPQLRGLEHRGSRCSGLAEDLSRHARVEGRQR